VFQDFSVAMMLKNEADESRPWSWRMSRNSSGTGANGDVLSHVISIGHFLTGSHITNVVGDINIVHEKRTNPDDGSEMLVDNDDMVSALVHFENGVKGHIGASRVTWAANVAALGNSWHTRHHQF